MKLKNVSIENYRFFKDEQEFEFTKDGKPQNILLYGENGSGKTSLYNALIDFFFYYKDMSKSKSKLRENKNIFCESEDEPKIEITFDNETTINFTKDGFDKDDFKSKIEQVSKSKLFLTYQDIYNLNNIFKKDISYKEFKEIFTILYFDELNDKFNQFEQYYDEVIKIVKNKNTLEQYAKYLTDTLDSFKIEDLHNLDNMAKKDESENYTKVFYLSDDCEFRLNEYSQMVEKLLDILSNKNTLELDTSDLSKKFDDIEFNINRYTQENCRFEEFDIHIDGAEKIELEDFEPVNRFLNNLESLNDFITNFNICEELSDDINDIIFDKLNASKDEINNILKFLDIRKSDFINFSVDYIFKEDIRNIRFKIFLSEKELKEHYSNLNEAKLSALNFAIYLSSVLQKKPDIPLLVLDDLLISLDMSNRDKIVELLLDRTKNEDGEYNYFDDEHQMFIFTHDRAFFEMAKLKFDNLDDKSWKYFEMYEDSSGVFPKPLLMPSEGNLEKAEAYFKKCDYPTAGNSLRKASEQILTNNLIVPFKPCEKDALDTIIIKYEQMCKEFKITTNSKDIESLKGYTKRVFNPSSHDDLKSPLYKKEIDDAIKLVKRLKELPTLDIVETPIKKGSLLSFKYDNKYEVVYRFLGDLTIYKYSDDIKYRDDISLVKCKHKIEDEEEQHFTSTEFITFKKMFGKSKHFINDKFKEEIDKNIFISNLTIDECPIIEEIKKLIKKQIG